VPMHDPSRGGRLLGPLVHRCWTGTALYFGESPFHELGWIAHSSGPIVITNFVEYEKAEVQLRRIPLLRLYEKWFSGGDPLL
jgi:hypothetical protein